MGIVDYHKPDLLISLGDWGEAVNEEEFFELLRKVRVWSIYGNHENMEVLRRMYNVLTGKYEPILIEDSEVREFSGLKFGAINGIVALRRRTKKGVPRKKPEEFIEYAKKLKGRMDVLLLHDSSKLPLEDYKFMRYDAATHAVGIAIYKARPKLVMCGHLHIEKPYTIYKYEHGTLYVRIDSSQKHRAYVSLYTGSRRLEIWRDYEILEGQDL